MGREVVFAVVRIGFLDFVPPGGGEAANLRLLGLITIGPPAVLVEATSNLSHLMGYIR